MSIQRQNLVELTEALKKHPFLNPLEIFCVIARTYYHGKRRGVTPKSFPTYRIGAALGLDPKTVRSVCTRIEHDVNRAYRATTKGNALSFSGAKKCRYILEDNSIVLF